MFFSKKNLNRILRLGLPRTDEDAGTRRLEAVANAPSRPLENIAKLPAKDGDAVFSMDNLKEILRLGSPEPDEESEADKG